MKVLERVKSRNYEYVTYLVEDDEDYREKVNELEKEGWIIQCEERYRKVIVCARKIVREENIPMLREILGEVSMNPSSKDKNKCS